LQNAAAPWNPIPTYMGMLDPDPYILALCATLHEIIDIFMIRQGESVS
jgi:hypothetical protein